MATPQQPPQPIPVGAGVPRPPPSTQAGPHHPNITALHAHPPQAPPQGPGGPHPPQIVPMIPNSTHFPPQPGTFAQIPLQHQSRPPIMNSVPGSAPPGFSTVAPTPEALAAALRQKQHLQLQQHH